jgi:hypothetical protein
MSTILENDEEPNILTSDEGDILFNIPGMIQIEDKVNVLVSGLKQTAPGRADITLMFLDPTQYQRT